tara:strand:+ start:59 stop:334 length:276 start_codon:yes stop_codon:yes gene_type:complete
MNDNNLEDMVCKIGSMNKEDHVEILRIIKKSQPTLSVSENTNGCFVNMSELTELSIKSIQTFINLKSQREKELDKHETIKNTIIESYMESS